jgi:hypothetical protein
LAAAWLPPAPPGGSSPPRPSLTLLWQELQWGMTSGRSRGGIEPVFGANRTSIFPAAS